MINKIINKNKNLIIAVLVYSILYSYLIGSKIENKKLYNRNIKWSRILIFYIIHLMGVIGLFKIKNLKKNTIILNIVFFYFNLYNWYCFISSFMDTSFL